jgi:uncharacterized protein (UPF0335 family)
MKQEIETQIKAIFKTKGAFYKSQGFDIKNGSKMIKSFLSSVERLNKFLKPLKKKLVLTDID